MPSSRANIILDLSPSCTNEYASATLDSESYESEPQWETWALVRHSRFSELKTELFLAKRLNTAMRCVKTAVKWNCSLAGRSMDRIWDNTETIEDRLIGCTFSYFGRVVELKASDLCRDRLRKVVRIA